MIAEYSAFNAVRSAAVGFRTELVERAGLIGAIGAMGTLQQPDLGYDRASPVSQFGSEINLIPEYMTGEIYWLKYKYSPHFQFSEHQDGMGMRAAEITFKDYPFEFPMWQAFSLKPSIDLKGEARMTDHASFFLEF